MTEDQVCVYETNDEIEAEIYKSMLEEAGIAVNLQALPDMWGQRTVWAGPTRSRFCLLVSPQDAGEAARLVESFHEQAASGALAEELEDEEEP